jgi:phosphopantetheinyl transferase
MPIVQTTTLKNGILGIWDITESKEELLHQLPFSEDEFEQFSKIKNLDKQREKLAGRVLAKSLMDTLDETYYGIVNALSGRPVLMDSPRRVSISHSGKYVAALITRSKTVGVDIQRIEPKIARIAPRVLSAKELEDCDGQTAKLCAYWSIKEVLYKVYRERQLNFIDHLEIQNFILSKNCSCTGAIVLDQERADFSVTVCTFEDYILAYHEGE